MRRNENNSREKGDDDYMARPLRRHTLMVFPGLSLVLRGLITFQWFTVNL